MGVVRNFLFFVKVCASLACFAQEADAIPWDESRKLTWEDFKGRPFKTAWAAATTASGISYEYFGHERENGYELEFKIGAFFYPDKSWYKPDLCNEAVLRHEQLHFDISELFARKFRKKLKTAKFRDNVKNEVRAIYEEILMELTAFQSRYDHDTNYSIDHRKQLVWNSRIAEALANSE